MSHCPSHDWDRYASEMDDAAEAEMQFLKNSEDRIYQMVAAQLAGGRPPMDGGLIDDAIEIVRDIHSRIHGDD